MRPFFSIGVTTYNRRALLKECLDSIQAQTFSDFEVLVGNDYTKDVLSGNQFGIDDARIKYVNHPRNLGEHGNMNALLKMSRGRYFTWLSDDDMYFPTFLESVYEALKTNGFLPCVFPSYIMGNCYPKDLGICDTNIELFKGKDFLHKYLNLSLKLHGCYGVFEKRYLLEIGGMKKLGNGFGPYSDVLLAIRAGLLEEVIYINTPTIFYRAHEGSISLVSPDVDAYSSAQTELVSESIVIFSNKGLSEDFNSNLYLLLRWCIRDYYAVMRRSGLLQSRKLIKYLLLLRRHTKLLTHYRLKVAIRILYGLIRLLAQLTRANLKNVYIKTSKDSVE